jgi:hypothetical protein
MSSVGKTHKHRKLEASKLHVTTTGVYIYEAQLGSTEPPKLKWGAPAKEIFSIVMG